MQWNPAAARSIVLAHGWPDSADGWGARAVANAVGLQPEIASHLVLVSVGYGTNSPDQPMSIEQCRRYWHHWFMATPRGQKTVRENGRDFARVMWDTWSPANWYSADEFHHAAQALTNPDWPEITLHSYQHRWGHADGFEQYAKEEQMLHPAPQIQTPTLILHGREDYCNVPEVSAGKEQYFEGRYERVLLPGLGHFPQREDPQSVAREILRFCGDRINWLIKFGNPTLGNFPPDLIGSSDHKAR